uniref:Uncharacterized protein n=1 Tax=Nelumbo nucifera TaxID=4432 RepID=A0A822XSC0_NELNU|nr:TPA_asm: hypothetical protein HUJ06_023514 [Nelumbo nucifera]
MREVVKHILDRVVRKTLYTAHNGLLFETRFYEELLQVTEHQHVFSYLDDPTNPSDVLLQLREVLGEKALNQSPKAEEESTKSGYSKFKLIPFFQ